MKTIFENSGGTYTQVGDYLLPNLSLPAEEKETNIGVWAMRHKRYLKQSHNIALSDFNFSVTFSFSKKKMLQKN